MSFLYYELEFETGSERLLHAFQKEVSRFSDQHVNPGRVGWAADRPGGTKYTFAFALTDLAQDQAPRALKDFFADTLFDPGEPRFTRYEGNSAKTVVAHFKFSV